MLLKQAVRNASFNGVATLGQFIVSFLFAGLTIRFLGDQRAGYLLMLQGLISLGGTVGGFGLGTAAVRRMAILYEQGKLVESRQCLGIVLFVNLLMGFLVAMPIILGFPWIFEWSKIDPIFYSEAHRASVLIAMTFLIQQAVGAYSLTLLSLQRYDLVALVGTLFGFLSGGLGLLILGFSPHMSSLAALLLGLGIVQLIVNGTLSKRLLGGITIPRWNWLQLRSLSNFGAWVYLGSVSGLLVSNMDKIVLTTFLGSQSLPYYVVGQRVYHQVHSALVNQSQYIFPMLSSTDRSSETIKAVEHRLRWFVGLVSAVLYGGLAIVSHPLLSKIVGPGFADSALAPFLVFCVVGFLHAQMIVLYYTSWAVAEGKPNSVMQLVNGVLVLVTTILLAPELQVVGAALAQLWVGPIMLVHVSWVLISGKRFNFNNLLSPLLTPGLTFLLLLCIIPFARGLNAQLSPPLIDLTVLAASVAVVSLGLMVEQRALGKYECVPTLWRASSLLLSKPT